MSRGGAGQERPGGGRLDCETGSAWAGCVFLVFVFRIIFFLSSLGIPPSLCVLQHHLGPPALLLPSPAIHFIVSHPCGPGVLVARRAVNLSGRPSRFIR